MVATVWWVSNTLARGRFVPPTQTLLDYPTPRGGIPGMNEMVWSVFSCLPLLSGNPKLLLYIAYHDFWVQNY